MKVKAFKRLKQKSFVFQIVCTRRASKFFMLLNFPFKGDIFAKKIKNFFSEINDFLKKEVCRNGGERTKKQKIKNSNFSREDD